jgi:hypothetical protein
MSAKPWPTSCPQPSVSSSVTKVGLSPLHHSSILSLLPSFPVAYYFLYRRAIRLSHVIYTVSQEEMSIFWEVTVSVILSKIVCLYVCPIAVSEIELFHCTRVWIWCPIWSFTPAVLRPVRFLFMGSDEE